MKSKKFKNLHEIQPSFLSQIRGGTGQSLDKDNITCDPPDAVNSDGCTTFHCDDGDYDKCDTSGCD